MFVLLVLYVIIITDREHAPASCSPTDRPRAPPSAKLLYPYGRESPSITIIIIIIITIINSMYL